MLSHTPPPPPPAAAAARHTTHSGVQRDEKSTDSTTCNKQPISSRYWLSPASVRRSRRGRVVPVVQAHEAGRGHADGKRRVLNRDAHTLGNVLILSPLLPPPPPPPPPPPCCLRLLQLLCVLLHQRRLTLRASVCCWSQFDSQ